MNVPNVDLTSAAAELGIDNPPPFVWSKDPRIFSNAEYNPRTRRIYAHPTLLTRWAHTGLPEVVRIRNPYNGLRFTAAHELAHYYQERRDPNLFFTPGGDYVREQRREDQATRPGMTPTQLVRAHRRNKYEAEADAIARRIWRKVQLT